MAGKHRQGKDSDLPFPSQRRKEKIPPIHVLTSNFRSFCENPAFKRGNEAGDLVVDCVFAHSRPSTKAKPESKRKNRYYDLTSVGFRAKIPASRKRRTKEVSKRLYGFMS